MPSVDVVIRHRLRRPLVVLGIAAGLVGGLSACGSDDSSDSSSSGGAPSAAATSAPAVKPLNLALLQELTAPRFNKDPNCSYGEWSENSTGISEDFRSKATTIQQFDCYKSKDQVGGFPTRGQQSIYVEFSDPTSAKAFADDQSTLYKSLVEANKVVVTGTGLDTVDMNAYLADIKNACGCGTVVGST